VRKKNDSGELYLKMYPGLMKWINECQLCHCKGYKPEMPEYIGGDYSLASKTIRQFFNQLEIDDNGFCLQCSKVYNKNMHKEKMYMEIIYKFVNVYVDESDNLIAFPTGESEIFGTKDLDIANVLNTPYSDNELENLLIETLNQCYSQKPNDTENSSFVERLLKVKGYEKAVKNRKLIGVNWNSDKGYSVIPTRKVPKQGYIDMENAEIFVGKNFKSGELAKAFKEAILMSNS